MAGLIKNQILKHLSKFTKNLSPDKIQVSTLKGEGELSHLELDENVLMEVMELPTWLRLTAATCNRVAIKIQWTKLKTQPICLFLDEIVVSMETCEKPRAPTNTANLSAFNTAGKYGFAERIIDGMYVSINSVVVNFKAPAFTASIQLSRMLVQSKTPLWQTADLRLTRIKDDLRGEVLIFKEAEWQTLRIEANALDIGDPSLATTPLRLIANQSKTRITIKKRLIDCGIVSSRVQFNLDDLLWVLTDSQLKAAIVFVNSLKEIVKRSAAQSKLLAAEKLKKQGNLGAGGATQGHKSTAAQQQNQKMSRGQVQMTKLFHRYDVRETSYHVHTGRIDLHLCDDSAPEVEGYRRKVEGGAMQITLHKVHLDFYPFHSAGADRSHWLHFDENMSVRNSWAQDLLNVFKEEVRRVRDVMTTPPTSPQHPPAEQLGGSPRRTADHSPRRSVDYSRRVSDASGRSQPQSPSRQHQQIRNTKLLETCTVCRIEDFVLYRVTTAADVKRSAPKKFLSSDKKQLLLPAEMSAIHIDFTDYYFPEGINYPGASGRKQLRIGTDELLSGRADDEDFWPFLPHANMYVVVNPVRLAVDYLTLVWLNAFSLNLIHSLDLPKQEGPKIHVDIRLDALMPRLVLPAEKEVEGQQSERPDALQIHASRLMLTNCRLDGKSSRQELSNTLAYYNAATLYSQSTFPKDPNSDFLSIPNNFKKHIAHEDGAYLDSSIGDMVWGRKTAPDSVDPASTGSGTYFNMACDSLKLDGAKDVWCLAVDQLWLEFLGVPSSRGRPVPFIESFPMTAWITLPLLATSSQAKSGCDSSSGVEASQDGPAALLQSGDVSMSRELTLAEQSMLNPQQQQQFCDSNKLSPVMMHVGENHNHLQSPHQYQVPPGSVMEPNRRSSQTGGQQQVSNKPPLADVHVLVKIGAKVLCQLNHYQYLFLMRMIESLSKTSAEIQEDTVNILGKAPESKRVSLAVKLSEAELAIIFPPIVQQTSAGLRSTSQNTSMQDLPEANSVSVLDELAGGVHVSTVVDHALPTENHHSGLRGELLPDADHLQAPSQQQPINKSHSDTDIIAARAGDELAELHPGQASPKIYISDSSGTGPPGGGAVLLGGGSSPQESSPLASMSAGQVRSAENVYLDSMPPDELANRGMARQPQHQSSDNLRKSFNTAFSSISKFTDKVAKNVKKDLLDINDDAIGDDWDDLSMKSGASSDDEDFVMLKLAGDELPAFERRGRENSLDTESDSPTGEPGARGGDPETASSVSSAAAAGDPNRNQMCVVSVTLLDVEVALGVSGDDVSLALIADHVIPREHGRVAVDKFQTKFASGEKEDHSHLTKPEEPRVKLRFELGPRVEATVPGAGELGFLRTVLSDLDLSLAMSSLTGFIDLIEDEIVPPNMPLLVEVSNCKICIKNDQPPTYPTSPGAIPIDLDVTDVMAWRAQDGVFHITHGELPFSLRPARRASHHEALGLCHTALPLAAMELRMQALAAENLKFQKQLAKYKPENQEQISRKNSRDESLEIVRLDGRLKELEQENHTLRLQLEKIGKLGGGSGASSGGGASGGANSQGRLSPSSITTSDGLHMELEMLRDKVMWMEGVQQESTELATQLVQKQDEVLTLKQERESLLATLQLLQEELNHSEKLRASARTPP